MAFPPPPPLELSVHIFLFGFYFFFLVAWPLPPPPPSLRATNKLFFMASLSSHAEYFECLLVKFYGKIILIAPPFPNLNYKLNIRLKISSANNLQACIKVKVTKKDCPNKT